MSQDYKITVDIYCRAAETPTQSYRIYVDGDLLTERTCICADWDQFIEETIIINVDAGKHFFLIEPTDINFNGFFYRNFKVNDKLTFIFMPTGEFTI